MTEGDKVMVSGVITYDHPGNDWVEVRFAEGFTGTAIMPRPSLDAKDVGDRWTALRNHITGERTTQDQLAADHAELGHDWASERAYGRVEALDRLLATMDRMEREP